MCTFLLFLYCSLRKTKYSLKDLRTLWKKQMKSDAPNYWQRNDFIEKLAYRIQEAAFGELPEKYQALLDMYVARFERGVPLFEDEKARQLPPGIILTRDYGNRRYSVKILDDEKVEYNGQIYNSLSAVAREITGVRWNGRKFFHCENK
jgi:hypothetical protein